MDNLTPIYLTDDDCDYWKKCMERKEDIELLFEGKFFEFKSGQGIINRDRNGILQSVIIQAETAKRITKKIKIEKPSGDNLLK